MEVDIRLLDVADEEDGGAAGEVRLEDQYLQNANHHVAEVGQLEGDHRDVPGGELLYDLKEVVRGEEGEGEVYGAKSFRL